MPTQEQINMYDLNGDGVLDQRDVELARQIGQNAIADAIESIIGGGTAAPTLISSAVTEISQAPTGAALTEKIDESLAEGYVQQQQLARQTQASDVQVNPLPSLPAVSNVGSVPFSGVVNQNAIPGGFQPLPQVAGGRKKLYQISKFHGCINQKSSPRDISDIECQQAVNITFSNIGRIKCLGDCKNQNNTVKTFPGLI